MRKKFFKVLLIAVSFFLFKNVVNAAEYFELIESSDNPTVCKYKSSVSENLNVKIEFGENEQDIKLYYYLDDKEVPLYDDTVNFYISKASECPKYIMDTTAGYEGYSKVKLYCGNIDAQGHITDIPPKIPELTSMIFTIIQIAVPIILVLLGSLDLMKGITTGKEDETKKGQQIFIKRLVVAAVIFFVVVIVKFFISVVADTNKANISDCIDCFINNDCEFFKIES